MVNEILPNGEVVHLTSLRPPKFSKDSSSEVALTEDAAQAGSKPTEVQGPVKKEVAEAIVPENEAVKLEPTLESTVRPTEEEVKLKSKEDGAELKAGEAESDIRSTEEELKAEESSKKQLATSDTVDATQQKPDIIAAATAKVAPEGLTGTGKTDPVSSVDKWQQFASQPKDFKVRPLLPRLGYP